jgi:hypothetical protein
MSPSPFLEFVDLCRSAAVVEVGGEPMSIASAARHYTHVLKGELERACQQLESFLAEREAEGRDLRDVAALAA